MQAGCGGGRSGDDEQPGSGGSKETGRTNETKRPRSPPHSSSGPTHPHHQVRWAPEADRPPSGRLPPPTGNATTRRCLPAPSARTSPGQPPPPRDRKRPTEPRARCGTHHPQLRASADRTSPPAPFTSMAPPSADGSTPTAAACLAREHPPCQPRIARFFALSHHHRAGEARFSPGHRHPLSDRRASSSSAPAAPLGPRTFPVGRPIATKCKVEGPSVESQGFDLKRFRTSGSKSGRRRSKIRFSRSKICSHGSRFC